MYGLRAGAAGMIAAAAWKVLAVAVFTLPRFSASHRLSDLFDLKAVCLFVVFLGCHWYCTKLHPIFLIIAGAVAGILVF